jgi:hypothetical protein
MVCFRYIIVNILHKVDNKDDDDNDNDNDNNNNNNNNNNCMVAGLNSLIGFSSIFSIC